jgi:DNA polymerase-3 subunit gamma/tau
MPQVLYRKYRPESFKEVLGQDHVVDVLKKSISLGNLSHAYLFSGSRGIGKTTVARIVAQEIDVYEIDAASNRGIDDIRELREAVDVLPFESKYKVYIIDEVHMLTKEAFNALLKTLEEPPEHVVFILATTEIDKLPETIVSRCQTFNFKKPDQSLLEELVLKIAKKEGFSLDKAAANLIGFLGDNSFRDAQGILQKVIGSSKDKKITVPEVEKITGAPRNSLINDLVTSIDTSDLSKALSIVEKANSQNIDMNIFLKLLLNKLRLILLLRFSKDLSDDIQKEIGKDNFEFLNDVALNTGGKIKAEVLNIFLQALEKQRFSHIQSLPIELALIEIIGQNI